MYMYSHMYLIPTFVHYINYMYNVHISITLHQLLVSTQYMYSIIHVLYYTCTILYMYSIIHVHVLYNYIIIPLSVTITTLDFHCQLTFIAVAKYFVILLCDLLYMYSITS